MRATYRPVSSITGRGTAASAAEAIDQTTGVEVLPDARGGYRVAERYFLRARLQVVATRPTPRRRRVAGAGTLRAPNSPRVSPSSPSLKYKVLASPPLPAPLPNMNPHNPPGVLPAPALIGIVPSKAPVTGSNALISLARKLKLPTSRSPPNWPNPDGQARYPRARQVDYW